MEEILNSCWHWRRFQLLVKWKRYGREHNSWEFISNISVSNLVVEFYCKHLVALRHIYKTDFDTIF